MKNIIKSLLFVTLTSLVFTACTDSDKTYKTETQQIQTYTLATNKTVAAIVAATSASPTLYTADDIIEAYVTSNDAAGNFYKSISFQTIPTDASAPIGFSVSVDKSMLFADGFTPGRKVYIKLNGLARGIVFGSMLIGVLDSSSSTGISGISKFDLNSFLFPSETIVAEDTFVRHMTLAQALNNANLNTLIEIDNTSFADNSIARTYFDVDNGGYATNHTIIDNTIGDITPTVNKYCRVSQYAPFSVGNVPSGRGSIRGVMTKYNSDYQFLVRQENDFKLTAARAYTFFSTLNESFASAVTSQISFPKYLNFASVGTKKWKVPSSGGVIEMSSYSGAVENSKAYFVVPVNMDAASTFKFDLKVSYFTNSTGFKVYRSSDYVPGMNIKNATLYDISSSLSQPMPSANTTLTALTYNIPASVTGNGYFIFEYSGTNISTGPPVTTTIDIDNIIVN